MKGELGPGAPSAPAAQLSNPSESGAPAGEPAGGGDAQS
jgi:hypothetical protein